MANSTYEIDNLAPTSQTVTKSDSDGGSDTLVMVGTYASPTDIRLSWTNVGGVSTSASGFYFKSGNDGRRLIVTGLIENVIGSDGVDFIQGNEVGNFLFGDRSMDGPLGGSDSIFGLDGNDSIFGGSGGDRIGGDGGNDELSGDAGSDTISGGLGADTIYGGAGADLMSGGANAGDTLSYVNSTVGVRVALTFGDTTIGSGGDAQGDSINGFVNIVGSSGNDSLTDTVAFGGNANKFLGEAGNDRLSLGGGRDTGLGGSGSETIRGGGDNDRLIGGADNDLLYGGAGRDRFIFTERSDSSARAGDRDRILDFRDGDRIDLKAVDAATDTMRDNAFEFIGRAAFSGDGAELRYKAFDGGLLVTGDTDGNGRADFSIFIDAFRLTALQADDFIL